MKFITSLICAFQYIGCWLNPYSDKSQKWSQFHKQYQISDRQVLTNTKLNFSVIVDSKDQLVSEQIRQKGIWQTQILRLIKKIVKSGDNVINIGSQIGLQAIFMGKLVGQSGRVFVFQPYSNSFRIMRKNVYLNGLQDQFFTYNIGASNAQEIGRMTVSYSNTGGSQVYQRSKLDDMSIKQLQKNEQKFERGWGQYEYITLNKADNVLPKQVSFSFALIDVQTMEIQALDGLRQVIKRSPNLVILVEWAYKQKEDQQLGKSVIQFLWGQGYTFYELIGKNQCFAPLLQKRDKYHQLRNVYRADFLLIRNDMQIDL